MIKCPQCTRIFVDPVVPAHSTIKMMAEEQYNRHLDMHMLCDALAGVREAINEVTKAVYDVSQEIVNSRREES